MAATTGGLTPSIRRKLQEGKTPEEIVQELVAGSFLADAPILPVSSKTGEGMDALRTALAALARAVAPPAQ